MTKDFNISEREKISYTNALKILGFKTTPDKTTLQKRYKNLAKKYHPDVSTEPDALEKFKQLSLAKKIIETGFTRPQKLTLKNYQNEYKLLRNKIGKMQNRDKIEEAYAKIQKSKAYRFDPVSSQKLEAAKERIIEENYLKDYLSSRSKQRKRRSIFKALLSDEERQIYRLREKANARILTDSMQQAHENLKKRAIRVKNKFYIPILVRKNRKLHVRNVLLTAGLITSIVLGKHAWNKRMQAYYRKKGALVIRK